MTDLHARIATRAYFAWLDAGRPDGQHQAHWLAAEWAEIEVDAIATYDARAAAAAEAGKAKRSDAAKRAAATRKANRAAARVIAASAFAKPARARRATTH